MRIDVITIFPDYLEPLRHALLGKAIEDGHLTVGIHDLRRWATGTHRSVDAPPAGGGPGMVMKPEVWGKALDDVAAGATEGTTLTSAEAHRAGPRHDELVGVDKHYYDGAPGEKPLLLVPTPTGTPFTQADAQAFSREEHIVFACGRYEGIDQRVFVDAEKRYRVREVSIGDYVLIGGEVAVLAITEAVARLIPGVLGNQASHLEDTFSDGLLEAPSYTKPRSWRGLDIPEVLLSGDHQKIAAWRRAQSLQRTKKVRPELLEQAELTDKDRFVLYARDVHTELTVLIDETRWEKIAAKLAKKLRRDNYHVSAIHAETIDSACEPLWRITINGRSERELGELTRLVAKHLPAGTAWYGTSDYGHAGPTSA